MISEAAEIITCAGVALLAAFVAAQGLACDLPPPETANVAAVPDGETLKLTDGKTVKLIGAKAPMPPLGWRGDDPWPFVDEAREALEGLALNKTVELRFGGRRTDRHGNLLAQVFVASGEEPLWLRDEPVRQGLARVYSLPDARACATELLAREREARAKRHGLWSSSVYRIQDALDEKRLDRLIHTFQLVEGTVLNVGEGGGRIYLNFAADWRRDFTVSIARNTYAPSPPPGSIRKRLQENACACGGGWRGGPMIEATHPEQIELLTGRGKDGV